MTIEEIRKNAPHSSTSYMLYCGKIEYLRFKDNHWEVYFINESSQGWGLANQYVIQNNINKLKPLY